MASGIPFGLGSFVLFVSILFSPVKIEGFILSPLSLKLSSIVYLIETYGAGAAASGKFPSFKHLVRNLHGNSSRCKWFCSISPWSGIPFVYHSDV